MKNKRDYLQCFGVFNQHFSSNTFIFIQNIQNDTFSNVNKRLKVNREG